MNHRNGILRVLAVSSALFLSACLSIPISTVYKLSKLSEADITNLDPTQIRAAVEVPENVTVDSSKITIELKLTSPKTKDVNPNDGIWPVQLVSSGRYLPIAIRPSEAGRKLYLYKLTPEAEAHLASVLAMVKAHPEPGSSVQISISLNGAFVAPPGTKSFAASAWLQLRSVDGPLLLIDDRTIDAAEIHKP